MVYTLNLKWLSFKQDISNLKSMLENQQSTYAILRYAQDIPESKYKRAMNMLVASGGDLHYRKLSNLVMAYAKVAGVGMIMDEEFVETVDCWVGFRSENDIVVDGMPFAITME